MVFVEFAESIFLKDALFHHLLKFYTAIRIAGVVDFENMNNSIVK